MRCAVQFAGEILAAEFRRSLLDLTYNGKSFDDDFCFASVIRRLIAPALLGAFLYSITSSAVICMINGTVRPSALAVLRLMTNSNFVDCWTGKSAGFSPLSIRPA
jgi:hypothetical protein